MTYIANRDILVIAREKFLKSGEDEDTLAVIIAEFSDRKWGELCLVALLSRLGSILDSSHSRHLL
jgi:hypothetical protein